MADRPHNISVGLSLVALVISCLSWWESHKARRGNELVNRPILSVGTTVVQATPADDKAHAQLWFYVPLKNTGKVTGKIVTGSVEMNKNMLPSEVSEDCEVSASPDIEFFQKSNQKEMLPGLEETLVGQLVVSNSCFKMAQLKFRVDVSVTYTDASSGQEYSQSYRVFPVIDTDELKARVKNKYGELWSITP